ncbi:serine hydrolase domain-containing protein [Alkalihalobacillus macyae]|uniref:serine hydrolase domain-containing protein n=1 Tax=Guptibacillus hwajinpoensis TaxID=208199 RepID=UPI00273AD092|nr:serine hydrolase domain-containing protein [Alkalihalobacillus macyae]MDP4552549.1 serine hydrolase domain-containing protein [Alkalihalobacillus macyae]
MDNVHTYLENLVDQRELPGAVLHVQHHGKTVFHKAYGQYIDRYEQTCPVTTNTKFDLASLTKVMATLPSILWLLEHRSLELDQSIQTYLKDYQHPDVTIWHALTHTAGLPADLEPPVKRGEKRDILKQIFQSTAASELGKKVQYSDIGMILLGKVIEEMSGMDLPTFTTNHLYKPWGLTETAFNPPSRDNTASTEWHSDHYIQGDVHDEKALLLGGASGSAGLFSTARDVAKFGHYFLFPDSQGVLSEAVIKRARTHVIGNRGLGFEVWSGHGAPLSCGRRWSEGSFGHTGFTGTSLWIDPEEELIVTFLTNMVHYGRHHNMKQIRPHLHSLISTTLTKGETF